MDHSVSSVFFLKKTLVGIVFSYRFFGERGGVSSPLTQFHTPKAPHCVKKALILSFSRTHGFSSPPGPIFSPFLTLPKIRDSELKTGEGKKGLVSCSWFFGGGSSLDEEKGKIEKVQR